MLGRVRKIAFHLFPLACIYEARHRVGYIEEGSFSLVLVLPSLPSSSSSLCMCVCMRSLIVTLRFALREAKKLNLHSASRAKLILNFYLLLELQGVRAGGRK